MKVHKLKPLVLAVGFAVQALAQQSFAQEEVAPVEEVLVTGFRQSLATALDTKRESANSMESIVAEDIGKMPDLNLAESIQRVPGVAITREGGEGRSVTVRGLPPEFTRITLNGMEVPASGGGIDSSGGINRSRSVDFNIFASELFNKININKSQRASIEEGGLASTVDLYTARPFDKVGLQARGSLQVTADNLAGEADPRLTAFFSNTFLDDTLGVLFSVAKSERTVRQEGFGSVRYSSPVLQNANYANSAAAVVTGDMVRPGGCDYDPNFAANNPNATAAQTSANARNEFAINCMFTPRLPRMDYFSNTVDRLGITGSVQYRPTDALEFVLDIATSKLENDRISYNYAAQFRNDWAKITPVAVTVDESGKYLTAGTFENVRVRSESRGQFSESSFTQAITTAKYDINDALTLSAMYGKAKSKHDEEQDRFNIDGPVGGNTFTFDSSLHPDVPSMSFGFDILNPALYTTAGGTVVQQDIMERENDTFKLDLEFKLDSVTINSGIIANTRTVDSTRLNATGLTAPAANLAASGYQGLAVLYSSQVDGGFASALDAPVGFPTDFMVMDIDVAKQVYGVGGFEANLTDPNTFGVKEKTSGIYSEINWASEVAGLPLNTNFGLRYVKTDTEAGGASNIGGQVVYVAADNSYNDVLPALNLTLEATDDLVFRFAANRNITRPGLTSLVPRITSVTPINGNISVGNPDLKPMSADSFDLGAEWYFTDESLVAFTLFKKDITDFIATYVEQSLLTPAVADVVSQLPQYDPTNAAYDANFPSPYTAQWNVNSPVNAQDVSISGYEVVYQQPFSFLPSFLSNLGLITNLTHVSGEATYEGNGTTITSDVPGLSKTSYNFTLYYEMDNWGARVSVNDRDDYITSLNGSNGNAQESSTGPTRVDFSAFYDMNDYVSFRLEVINLNEEDERNYTTGVDGDLNLVREINNTGREVIFGVTAKL